MFDDKSIASKEPFMVTRTRRSETGTAAKTKAKAAPRAPRARPRTRAHATVSDTAKAEHPAAERRTARGNGADEVTIVQRAGDTLVENAGSIGTAVAVGVAAAVIEAELIPGILIGAGAVLLGKMFPSVAAGLRPVAKTVLRAGIAATDKAREVVAEAGEQVQDMVAEVQAEREHAGTRPRSRRARTAAAAA
jgi:hypothetical protein